MQSPITLLLLAAFVCIVTSTIVEKKDTKDVKSVKPAHTKLPTSHFRPNFFTAIDLAKECKEIPFFLKKRGNSKLSAIEVKRFSTTLCSKEKAATASHNRWGMDDKQKKCFTDLLCKGNQNDVIAKLFKAQLGAKVDVEKLTARLNSVDKKKH